MEDGVVYRVTFRHRLAYLGDGRFANYRLPRDLPEIEIEIERVEAPPA